ncbi:MAG: N-acetylmuramoyl-L-alanine amidase [Cyanobium sp.]
MNNGRLPPLMPALLGVTALGVGLLGWLASGLRLPGRDAGSDRLLDLLQSQPWNAPVTRPAPRPPLVAWQSPMTQICPTVDGELQRRLAFLRPRVSRIRTDPSNFGERFQRDVYGNRIDPTPRVVVLHETVYGLQSAISTFVTPHPNDEDQVSYHTLVGLDGEIVQVLDPSKRAFGAGNSAFQGAWVVTNPKIGGSINNFALHLSLETPLDGENEALSHSGYTEAQYDAAALVLADWMRRFNISWQNITTHLHVDLGGERADPRSFNWTALRKRLIALGVGGC